MHVRRSYTADGYTSIRTLSEVDCIDAENVRALTFRAGEMALSERKVVRFIACPHKEPLKQLGLLTPRKSLQYKPYTAHFTGTSVHICIPQPILINQTAAYQVSRTKVYKIWQLLPRGCCWAPHRVPCQVSHANRTLTYPT